MRTIVLVLKVGRFGFSAIFCAMKNATCGKGWSSILSLWKSVTVSWTRHHHHHYSDNQMTSITIDLIYIGLGDRGWARLWQAPRPWPWPWPGPGPWPGTGPGLDSGSGKGRPPPQADPGILWINGMITVNMTKACIYKWAKSKFDNITPQELFSGPTPAILNTNSTKISQLV